WEIEHHGNVLNRYGFSTLAKALEKADARALMALLAPDFIGYTLHQPREVKVEKKFARITRLEDSGHAPDRMAAPAFVDRLLKYRGPFTGVPKVKVALMSLSPAARAKLKGPWKGLGQLRMWGEAAPGQPREVVLDLKFETEPPTQANLTRGGWLHS